MKKTYALFCFKENTPHGGWSDFQDFFHDPEIAQQAGAYWAQKNEVDGVVIWQVVDLTTTCLVAEGYSESKPAFTTDSAG